MMSLGHNESKQALGLLFTQFSIQVEFLTHKYIDKDISYKIKVH